MRPLGALSIAAAARMVLRRHVGRRCTRKYLKLLAPVRIAMHMMMLPVRLLVLLPITHSPSVHLRPGNKH